MSLSVLTSLSVPPFFRATEVDLGWLVSYMFSQSCVTVGFTFCLHCLVLLSAFALALAPLLLLTPLFFLSLTAESYFGLEPLLAVFLPFRSSRHGNAEHLHPWVASAAAGCLLTALASGMSVRGGSREKWGTKGGRWMIIGWWGRGRWQIAVQSQPILLLMSWGRRVDADFSVLYSGSAHTNKSSPWFFYLSLSHTRTFCSPVACHGLCTCYV